MDADWDKEPKRWLEPFRRGACLTMRVNMVHHVTTINRVRAPNRRSLLAHTTERRA